MTAILISRLKTNLVDILYATVDRRVTANSTIISDNHKKIRTFEANTARPFRRHVMFQGDLSPVDYIADRLNNVISNEELFQYVFESDIFVNMPTHNSLYIIDETENGPTIMLIDKDKQRVGVSNIDLDELLMSPIFDGIGGEVVVAAHNALKYHGNVEDFESGNKKTQMEAYETLLEASFEIGAQICSAMNNRVDILSIKIPKVKK